MVLKTFFSGAKRMRGDSLELMLIAETGRMAGLKAM